MNHNNTRESVEQEFRFAVFDVLVDQYNEGEITLEALRKSYIEQTTVPPATDK